MIGWERGFNKPNYTEAATPIFTPPSANLEHIIVSQQYIECKNNPEACKEDTDTHPKDDTKDEAKDEAKDDANAW